MVEKYEPDVNVILEMMNERFDDSFDYGRIYQILERLVNKGLVKKYDVDGWRNGYMLTNKGLQELKSLQELLNRKLAVFSFES